MVEEKVDMECISFQECIRNASTDETVLTEH